MTDRDVTDADVFDTVRGFALETIDAPADLFTPDAKLGETLGMDSVHLIEIAGQLEATYGIALDDHELYDLVTVQDYVDLVEAKRAKGAAS